MAWKTNSTAPAELSTLQTATVILAPIWIIVATVIYGLFSGEVQL